MSLHANRGLSLGRRDRSRLMIVAVSALVAAVVLTTLQWGAKPTTGPLLSLAGQRSVACAGRTLQVKPVDRSTLVLTCQPAVTQVGAVRTRISARAARLGSYLPRGTTAGTLLVTTVQTSAASKVTLAGWQQADERVGGAVRLSLWWRVAVAGQHHPVVRVSPAARVSILTTGFAGVDVRQPLAAATASPGPGELSLLALGADGPGLSVQPPTGATEIATVTNGAEATTSLAIAQGGTSAGWTTHHARTTLAGVLRLRPAPAGAVAPAGATTLAAGATMNVSCGPAAATYSLAGTTVVNINCGPTTGRGIEAVGRPQTFTSGNSGSAHTLVPTGVSSGDLLVSTVSTYGFAKITFGAGWTSAYDAGARSGVRLVTAWKRAVPGEATASATVSPATQVSMATMAFRNVDQNSPVEASRGAMGATSPDVSSHAAGALLVLSHGSTGWRIVALPPRGSQIAVRVHDGGNSEVAMALAAHSAAGEVAAQQWSPAMSSTTVASGTLALRPAPGAGLPQPPVPPVTSSPVASVPASPPVSPSAPPTSSAPAPSVSAPATAPAPAPAPDQVGTAPSTPPAQVCDSSSLAGPTAAPAGAVAVSPSQNLGDVVTAHGPRTTYWLAPGTYRLGTGTYDQVIPHAGDVFIGAPGAILDGQHKNNYAFTGGSPGVTVSHLTIQNFGAVGGNNNEGVVNHDSAKGWSLLSNTIQNNAGAGIMIGSGDRVVGNCVRRNGQYAFNAYSPNGVADVVLSGNEIAGNNTDNWESRQPGCGCTGGGKFWATNGARVVNNYVHDNRGVGLWADTNNANFLFQGNYISGNDDEGLMYETSYNAAIVNNTFVRNALVKGPTNPGFPASAIYLSESGSDPRIAGPYGSTFRIAGNVFTDNWAGIIAWENADRFAGSPANSSTDTTTLVNPSVATEAACGTPAVVAKGSYFSDCRWKTQNLSIVNNTFSLNPANLSRCTASNGCGFNGLFSNYGTYPSWSPYKGEIVENNLTFHQNNLWQNNTYRGPWSFVAKAGGNVVSWATWRAAPYNQDAGSSFGG